MEENELFSFILEAKGESNSFRFNKNSKHLLKKMDRSRTKLNNFILHRVHPYSRQKLNYLIETYMKLNHNYLWDLNKQYYREGFFDGMKIKQEELNR